MNIVKTRKEDKYIVQFNGREYHNILSIVWDRFSYKITPYVHEYLLIDRNKLKEHNIRSFKEYGKTNMLVFTMYGYKEGVEIRY